MSEDIEFASAGYRIRFEKQDKLLVSVRIFSDGKRFIRIIVDPEKMEYRLVDPVTGFIVDSGGNVTNLEVLHRKAKKALKKLLGLSMPKEKRNVTRK
jgi:hypothetical protein